MRRRMPFLAVAVATLLAMNAGSALATFPGTLDAEQTSFVGTLTPESMLAQTFVPTVSGSLDTVEVYTSLEPVPTVAAGPNTVPDITVSITGTDGSGFPTSTILASETLAPPVNLWLIVVFSVPTNVVAGTKYAIVVTQDPTSPALWNGSCLGDPYGPGTALIFDSTWQTVGSFFAKTCLSDFAFQTYITPPAATPAPPTPAPTASPSPFQSVQGVTAAPTLAPTLAPTPPPTNTGGSGSGDNPGYLLIFAGLAAGAAAAVAFASTSRRRIIRR